jgi:hypothetical protein
MTAFEFYAFFGSPILLLLWALLMFWLTGVLEKREDRRRTPAE